MFVCIYLCVKSIFHICYADRQILHLLTTENNATCIYNLKAAQEAGSKGTLMRWDLGVVAFSH